MVDYRSCQSYLEFTYFNLKRKIRKKSKSFWLLKTLTVAKEAPSSGRSEYCSNLKLVYHSNCLLHADLVVVLGAVAASVSVELRVLLPDLCIAAVTGSDPAEELLQFGAESASAVTAAAAQVLHDGPDQDLQNLRRR